ncbi:MAG: site-specific integrase [Armatimonadetes bacterium]|nr:site-specific integrase [Armatimonadota bacterium]
MRGHVERRGRGYRVTIHIGYAEDGTILRHRKTLSSKKSADKYLRDKLAELETEGSIRARNLETFEQFIARWLEVCGKQRVRQRTFEDYSWVVGRHVNGTELGRQPLTSVTPLDIQERYSAMMAAGTGPHGVRKLHAVIRQALQQAVRWRELGVNPALSVDLPRIKRKPELRLLAADEFPRFLAAVVEEVRLAALWVLALATGMRPEEYLGLKWDDFSPTLRKVTIVRVLVRPLKVIRGKPTWYFEAPKTEKSRRTLTLDPPVVLLLKQHRAQQAAEKLAAGPAYQDYGLVFATELGEPVRSDNLRKRNLKRILKRAGLPENLTLYSMRHSAATALLKDRESLKVVSELLGHSTIRLTGDIYSHVTDDLLEEAASKLTARIFGGAE